MHLMHLSALIVDLFYSETTLAFRKYLICMKFSGNFQEVSYLLSGSILFKYLFVIWLCDRQYFEQFLFNVLTRHSSTKRILHKILFIY